MSGLGIEEFLQFKIAASTLALCFLGTASIKLTLACGTVAFCPDPVLFLLDFQSQYILILFFFIDSILPFSVMDLLHHNSYREDRLQILLLILSEFKPWN